MIGIKNIKYLCYVLGTNIDTIEDIVSNIDTYYHTWEKVKYDKETGRPILKDGVPKIRILNTTNPKLKRIQKRLYKFILIHSDLPEYAYGGIPRRDNVLNAKQHQGNKFIFTTDLKSFFPSISNSDIFIFFIHQGCTPTISHILTKLTTYKHQLPQGVPTSTLLANLIFKKTGDKLEAFSQTRNILFTSFVDDLTFSSKTCFKKDIPNIIEIIKDDGYSISHQKTFYKTKNPVITGVVCQNNRLKLNGSYYKRLSRIKKQSENKPKDLSLQKTEEGLYKYRRKVEDNSEKHCR